MENSGNQNQSRFLIAAVLSLVVLFGWSYIFPPKKPAADDANTAANTAVNANTAQATTPQAATTAQAPTPAPAEPQAVTADNVPNRTITIKSPLYELKLDSKGAVATSWILIKNKSPKGEFALFADGSTAGNEKPLQLISEEALNRSPREIPFRLATDDPAVTSLVNDRNYQISEAGDEVIFGRGPGEADRIYPHGCQRH